MAAFTATMLALSGVASAGSSIASGIASSREAKYNASLYGQQASLIEAQKNLEAYRADRQIGQVRSTGIARTAKSGLMLSGSPLATMIDTETQMQLDKLIGQFNLEVEKRQALEMQKRYRQASKYAMIGGFTNAFTQLLQTGSNMKMQSGKATNTKIQTNFDTSYQPVSFASRAGSL